MKSADASLHYICVQRKLLAAPELDAALAEAYDSKKPLERVLLARGVAAETLDGLLKIRARHGYPCEGCKAVTFILPGEARETKPCEACGDRLGATPAPPPPTLVPPPPPKPAAPEPAPLERPRDQKQGIVQSASGRSPQVAASSVAPSSGRLVKAEPSPSVGEDVEAARAVAPAQRAGTFAPPVEAKAADRPYERATFEVPAWIWSLVFLGILWAGNQLLGSLSSHPAEPAGEPLKKWSLPGELVLAEVEPWPLKPGKATLRIEAISEDAPVRGAASFRLSGGKAAAGTWHDLAPAEEQNEHAAAWSGEVVLPHGKVKLELRVPSAKESEPAIVSWDVDVGESPSPGHGLHVPSWARAILVLVLALYVGAPLAVRLSLKQPARPRAVLVDAATLTPAVGGFLQTRALEIEKLGFERVPYYEVDLGPNGIAYVCRLIDRANGDMAHATALCARSGEPRVKYAGFVTRWASGSHAETTNSPVFSDLLPRPPYVRVRQVQEDSLAKLLAIHRGLAAETEKGSRKVLPEPGQEGEQLARAIVEPLETAAKAGTMALSADGAFYRPTLRGAFVMTWRMLPPLRQLASAARAREERRLKASYGV